MRVKCKVNQEDVKSFFALFPEFIFFKDGSWEMQWLRKVNIKGRYNKRGDFIRESFV